MIENLLEESFAEVYASIDLARLMDNGVPMGTKEFTDYIVKKIYERK